MLSVIFYVLIIIALTITWTTVISDDEFLEIGSFKDYLNKYEPSTVYEKISKLEKERKKNFTNREYVDMFMELTDNTDDLLKLKVQDGDTRMILRKDGRRWVPPPGLFPHIKDRFSIKPRMFELMKQAIYQARHKMIIMQRYRAKYREGNRSKLYRMGYMTSKTDQYCRTFAKFNFQAYKACSYVRQEVGYYLRLYELLLMEERLLNLWFTVELLSDVIIINNDEFELTMADHRENRLGYWDFDE